MPPIASRRSRVPSFDLAMLTGPFSAMTSALEHVPGFL